MMIGSEQRYQANISVTAAGIPYSLRACFQEYDIEQLDLDQYGDLIIERTLACGNRRELRWLFEIYGREQIITWVKRLGARRLPWRRCNLWCVLSIYHRRAGYDRKGRLKTLWASS